MCDHDVDARVASTLVKLGHEAWTIGQAHHARYSDDEVTVYADDHDAVLISHDVEFGTRRRANVIGRHLWLRCREWDGPEVVERHLPDIVPILERHRDVWVRISHDNRQPDISFSWPKT